MSFVTMTGHDAIADPRRVPEELRAARRNPLHRAARLPHQTSSTSTGGYILEPL